MSKILLDYVFPVTVITPTPAASTDYLKQVCLVVKPKEGVQSGTFAMCINNAEVAELTDNENAAQLFNAGMSRVYILASSDLDIAEALEPHLDKFFTVLISDDFEDQEIEEGITTEAAKASIKIQDLTYTAKNAGAAGNLINIVYVSDSATAGSEVVTVDGNSIQVEIEDGVSTAQQIATAIEGSVEASALVDVAVDVGDESDPQTITPDPLFLTGGVDEVAGGGGLDLGKFDGVVGISSSDITVASEQAKIEKRCAFYVSDSNGAKNMCYAFGKLLSNLSNWTNQQYIPMPFDDGVNSLGLANNLFEERVSFVINDSEFANRLAMFASGSKAIVAPYIIENLKIDLQSRTLQYISANQPQYTVREASLLENRLNEDVIALYIARNWITDGQVLISLHQDNFVANGFIEVPEPKALWRVFSELRHSI